MKKKMASRMISLLLTVAMLFTMTGVSAFAEGEGEEETQDTKNVLVFGASTSSGYGLSDFYNDNAGFAVENDDLEHWSVEDAIDADRGRISESSYPWKLKKYIQETEGVNVNLSSMCLNGMRSNELHALLDANYYEAVYEWEKATTAPSYNPDGANPNDDIGFLTNHIRSFVRHLGWGGAEVDGVPVSNSSMPKEQRVWPSWSVGLPGTDCYKRASAYTKAEIKKADVIVVDVCMNNFGTYMAERIAGKFGVPGKEYAQNYWKQQIKDIVGVSDKVVKGAETLKTTLQNNMSLLNNENAMEFFDSFVYCYADCITNFSADVELIKEINPTAKIITVGVYNTLDGINLIINGDKIDFGGIAAKGFDLVNAYIKGIDKNSNNYYYADVSGGIETFMNQIRNAESLDDLVATEDGKALMDNMYDSFREDFLVTGLAKDQIAQQMGLSSWDDIPEDQRDAIWNQYGEDAKAQVREVIDSQFGTSIRKLLYDAGIVNDIDLDELMGNLHNMNAVQEEIMAALTTGAEPSSSTMQLLHVVDRFILYMGIGQHPSLKGCLAMADDVITAYDKLVNGGNTAYEDQKEEIQAMLNDLLEMLRKTGAKDDIDAIIEKINKIQAAMDMLDEAQASMEQLRELMAMKEQFEQYVGEALDLLGITVDDLIAQGQFIADQVDPVWVAEQIKLLNDIIMNWPELKEEYQAKIEEYYDKIMDKIDEVIDEIIKQKDIFENSEAIKKIIETIEVLREAVKNMPKSEEEFKELALEQMNKVLGLIEDKVAEVSEDLAAQIKDIREKVEKAVTEGDYQALIDELLPLGEKLLAIGEAVSDLPEYRAAMDEYMETSKAIMEGLDERVTALEKQAAKLTAKSIKVELKTKLTFPKKKAKVTLSWDLDEDAAGYDVTVNGKAVEPYETKTGMAIDQTSVKIGKTYKYEVTPYIFYENNGDTEIVYGKTVKKTFVPKVKLKKAVLKKVKAGKKSFKATWKKVAKADGYKLSYKVGKKTKTKFVKGAKKLSVTVKKLKKGKKYTVKVRAYKTVNGKKYYGAWSKAKKVKVK